MVCYDDLLSIPLPTFNHPITTRHVREGKRRKRCTLFSGPVNLKTLRTLVTVAAGIVNRRLLTRFYEDPNDLRPLTSIDFIDPAPYYRDLSLILMIISVPFALFMSKWFSSLSYWYHRSIESEKSFFDGDSYGDMIWQRRRRYGTWNSF